MFLRGWRWQAIAATGACIFQQLQLRTHLVACTPKEAQGLSGDIKRVKQPLHVAGKLLRIPSLHLRSEFFKRHEQSLPQRLLALN